MADQFEAVTHKATAIDRALDEMQRSAERIRDKQVADIAERYERPRDLPRLLRDLSSEQIADRSYLGRLRIVKRLHAAYEAERSAARVNHWSRAGMGAYRCISFLGAIAAEERALAALADMAAQVRAA